MVKFNIDAILHFIVNNPLSIAIAGAVLIWIIAAFMKGAGLQGADDLFFGVPFVLIGGIALQVFNLGLYGRIVIAGILSLFILFDILGKISSNSLLLLIPAMIITFFGLVIGYFIFNYLRNRYTIYITKKSVNIFCILLVCFTFFSAITEYYTIVPPAEIQKNWICDTGQELCNKFDYMHLYLVDGIGYGTFVKDSWSIAQFKWKYDRISNEITLYEVYEVQGISHPNDICKLKLRLEITGDKDHYKMKTYYVSSSGKFDLATHTSVSNATGNYNIVKRYPTYDNEQFNGVTWTEDRYLK
jgi:hypothetical protein